MPGVSPLALVTNGSVRLKQARHGLMLYNIHDKYVGRSIDCYGEFSFEEFKVFDAVVKRGMTVLDVGANIGAHTLGFAKAVGPTGIVIAFEPQRILHQLLCANLALNEAANVRALHAGAGRATGQASIPPVNYGATGNFGGISLQGGAGAEAVRVVTIDSLALGTCDFIKVDVEGMEEDVIIGATETIGKHRPILYVENDRREKSAALIERISGLDYESYWHLPRLFSPQNIYGNPTNVFANIVSVNMFCVPREKGTTVEGLQPVTDPTPASDGQVLSICE